MKKMNLNVDRTPKAGLLDAKAVQYICLERSRLCVATAASDEV
ncbi:hypothetical protein [uncultured Duncaniella sp.]|nr:hypothetical protein [uncultured Duncaniella sp.]